MRQAGFTGKVAALIKRCPVLAKAQKNRKNYKASWLLYMQKTSKNKTSIKTSLFSDPAF